MNRFVQAAWVSTSSMSRRGLVNFRSNTRCCLIARTRSTASIRRSSIASFSSILQQPPARSSYKAQATTLTTTTKTTTRLQMSTTTGADILKGFSKDDMHGQDIEGAMEALANADCVCFDVDSTVVDEEGIDVLADHLGKGEEVAKMTLAAMEGGMKFQDALAARLDLLQPSKSQIKDCLKAHPLRLTPGVDTFVQELQAAKKDVFLVSGGFRIMIETVATTLKIPEKNIVANTILFDSASGDYAGFDPNEPTSKDMGKPRALEQIQKLGNYKCMVMIGDGATDAQAKPPAKAFIGFGGVAVREKVKATADWFVTSFDDLIQIVKTHGNKK